MIRGLVAILVALGGGCSGTVMPGGGMPEFETNVEVAPRGERDGDQDNAATEEDDFEEGALPIDESESDATPSDDEEVPTEEMVEGESEPLPTLPTPEEDPFEEPSAPVGPAPSPDINPALEPACYEDGAWAHIEYMLGQSVYDMFAMSEGLYLISRPDSHPNRIALHYLNFTTDQITNLGWILVADVVSARVYQDGDDVVWIFGERTLATPEILQEQAFLTAYRPITGFDNEVVTQSKAYFAEMFDDPAVAGAQIRGTIRTGDTYYDAVFSYDGYELSVAQGAQRSGPLDVTITDENGWIVGDDVYHENSGLWFSAHQQADGLEASIIVEGDGEPITSLHVTADETAPLGLEQIAVDPYSRVWIAVDRDGFARIRRLDCLMTPLRY